MTPSSSTSAAPSASILRGGEWLLRAGGPGDGLHARAADRGASADRADRHRLRRQGGAAGARSARAEGLGARAIARAALRRARPARRRRRPRPTAALQLDKVTSMIVSEQMSQSASFGATFGAHANLMILPLSLFGTEAQKRQYLPQLLTARSSAPTASASRARAPTRSAPRRARTRSPTAASCSTARRCGSPTAASPTSSSCSPR